MNITSDELFLSHPEATLILQPEGTIVAANREAERITGFSTNEVIGENVSFLLPSRDDRRVNVLSWFKRWSEEPDHDQSRFLDLIAESKGGEEYAINARVSKFESDGSAYMIVGFRNVSPTQKERREAHDATLWARRTLQISEDAIISLDADQAITFFNVSAEQLFGYREEELLGQSIERLLPERYRHNHSNQISEFRRSKQPSRLMGDRGEIIGLTRDGEEIPFEASITMLHIGGQPSYTAYLRDIRARKRTLQMLEESEDRFRAIFDNAHQAMALLDLHGNIIEFNASALTLTESDAPPIGLKLWEVSWLSGDQEDEVGRQEGIARLKTAVQIGVAGNKSQYVLNLNTHEDGARIIDFSITPALDEDGHARYLVAEGRDVTNLEHL